MFVAMLMTAMRYLAVFLFCAGTLLGQSNSGELRIRVTDPSGLGVRSSVELVSEANQFQKTLTTDSSGELVVKRMPFGVYRVQIDHPGFAVFQASIEVRSAIPADYTAKLSIAAANTSVIVNDTDTLIDPHRTGDINRIGSDMIQERVSSLPGRSLQDLVNTQPGWLYEGNAVLHPRGSEYQTQFVIDGIPLTDNRTPSFGPEIEADDISLMSIYTAGFPAEFGRKLGGVIGITTKRKTDPGLHGQLILSGGSYDTAASFGQIQGVWGKNALNATASGSMTSHYLNPVVPENFTNKGTTGDFSVAYDRDPTERDRLSASVRHELSRFQIPNELLQQQAGQIQNGDNFETMGTASYQHIFSQDMLGNLVGMVRDNANNLYSNPDSTPIIAFQHNYFREGYFKGTFSVHQGNQEWKAGVESDAAFLHEKFNYQITDEDQFDDDTANTFSFADNRPDLEQSAFVEDLIRLGRWTVSAGLRWDHYQLLLNQNAFSPRLSVGRYIPSADIVLHLSYDRIFQTPSFENILLSNSTQITSLSDSFLRLPVQPSKGNYFEAGLTKGFSEKLRFDANFYRRNVRNFADDDQLLNTGVSYPITFDKAVIYGAEGKLELIRWGKLSGFLSYSYMVGDATLPVTGGLFLGDDVPTQLAGHFPVSQDQRNTVRTRLRYQLMPRLWLATGAASGSGLPFEFTGSRDGALAQYGPKVVDRLNFDRGRVDPLLAVNASLGVDLFRSEKQRIYFQVDGDNLNNRLNVIDFRS